MSKTVKWIVGRKASQYHNHYLTGDLNLTLCGREVPSEYRQGITIIRDGFPVTCLRCVDIQNRRMRGNGGIK